LGDANRGREWPRSPRSSGQVWGAVVPLGGRLPMHSGVCQAQEFPAITRHHRGVHYRQRHRERSLRIHSEMAIGKSPMLATLPNSSIFKVLRPRNAPPSAVSRLLERTASPGSSLLVEPGCGKLLALNFARQPKRTVAGRGWMHRIPISPLPLALRPFPVEPSDRVSF
jgi:hypothetical protein